MIGSSPPLALRVGMLMEEIRRGDQDFDLRALDLRAVARPPLRPPFFADALLVFLPRPEPLFFPPPLDLFTVAHARLSASFLDVPRFS